MLKFYFLCPFSYVFSAFYLKLVKVIMIALSCIRTIDTEHIPYLLRFVLLSAKASNARRIISQIRGQLKFVGAFHLPILQHSKSKEKSIVDNTNTSILDALRSSLNFNKVGFILHLSVIFLCVTYVCKSVELAL